MQTLIVKEGSNELVNSNLRFRVLMNRKKADLFRYETYSEAKSRLEVLKKIFSFSKMEILIIE